MSAGNSFCPWHFRNERKEKRNTNKPKQNTNTPFNSVTANNMCTTSKTYVAYAGNILKLDYYSDLIIISLQILKCIQNGTSHFKEFFHWIAKVNIWFSPILKQDIMSAQHCGWVGGAASFHFSRMAQWARREAKDKAQRFSTVNCTPFPVILI